MSVSRQILLLVLLLAGVMGLFEATDLDLRLQDRFHDFRTHQWLIDKKAPLPRAVLYHGMKGLAIAAGVAAAAAVVLSLRVPSVRPHRRAAAMLLASLGLVPLSIATLKKVSNVYTPDQILRYGGPQPYVKPLERYPAGFHQTKRGRGFPAGHASGGFAFLSLYFVFRRRAWRLGGLAFGLAAGWAMGLYQMLTGEHYLSHTLVTMLLTWIIVLLLRLLLPDSSSPAAPVAAPDRAGNAYRAPDRTPPR